MRLLNFLPWFTNNKKPAVVSGLSFILINREASTFVRLNLTDDEDYYKDLVKALKHFLNYKRPSIRYSHIKMSHLMKLKKFLDKNKGCTNFTIIICEKKDNAALLNHKNLNIAYILYGIDRFWVEVFKDFYDIY